VFVLDVLEHRNGIDHLVGQQALADICGDGFPALAGGAGVVWK
jgi:hypothetical protein